MERIIQWGVRRYLGGPGRSWLFTTLAVFGYRAVRSAMGRKELVDVGGIGKGQKIVIEHLSVTHGQQLKEEKDERRTAKKAKRSARRSARSIKRVARRERRLAKKAESTAD